MKFLYIFILLFFCTSCKNKKSFDDLTFLKKDFIDSIIKENVDESPFFMDYHLKTVFFSKELISLFGELTVYDHLPHGWHRYEGKTYIKIAGKFYEILLNDLFTTPKQKESLRSYCEKNLKIKTDKITYFSDEEPLLTKLDFDLINTFVIDEHFLIIIFQRYSVGGLYDTPFVVKIPYEDLKNMWNPNNSLVKIWPKIIHEKEFTSSFDEF